MDPNTYCATVWRAIRDRRWEIFLCAKEKSLEELDLTVSLEPEFMTSQQASRLQGENDKLDASSAAIILQSYLDRRNN